MSGLNRTPGKRVQSICSDAGSNPAPSAKKVIYLKILQKLPSILLLNFFSKSKVPESLSIKSL
jgi:hypothetical protein